MEKSRLDHKGLIKDSYLIEGIKKSECRSIFLDWALSVEATNGFQPLIRELLAIYEDKNPDHPMTQVLREGLKDSNARPVRRGGSTGRTRIKRHS